MSLFPVIQGRAWPGRLRPFTPRGIASGTMALLLLLAVACGTAATATPAPKPTTAPAPSTGGQATPTAMPKATPTPAAPVVNPGKLTWMVASWGAARFDSVLSGTGVSNQYARQIHGFLIAANPQGSMIPGIATDWSISADGLAWTVNLRDGVQFHDGTSLTAADVAWSMSHEMGPDILGFANSTTSQAAARNAAGVEQTGPKQVTYRTKAPDSGVPSGLWSEAGPNWLGHILPKRAELHNEAAETAYDQKPIGAGPFKLIRHVPAEVMEFERFENFYYQPKNGLPEDRRPKFKFLDLRVVPEEATRVAALRAKEADVAPISISSKKQLEAGGGRVIFGPEGVYMRVMLHGCFDENNLYNKYPCKDKKVRQALDLALNKNIMRDQLYGGPDVFSTKGWEMVTPGSIGYSPDLDVWPQDIAKAKRLMAEAGYPNGQGFGKLIVNTWVSASMPNLPEAAQLAADTWRRELGLDTEVKIGDEAALNAARRSGALNGQITFRDNEARLDGASILRSSYGTPTQTDRMHHDQAIFDMVAKTLAVTDPAQRGPALNTVYKRLRDETYELGMGYVNIPWGVGPRVAEWQPFTFSFFPSGMHTIVLK